MVDVYTPTESLTTTWYARNRIWRHMALDKRDRVSDFPAHTRGLGLDRLPNTVSGVTVRDWAKRWGKYPTSGLEIGTERGKGLWLYGPPDGGKTTMASIAAQHVSSLGWSTKFIYSANLHSLHLQAMNDEEGLLSDAAGCYENWDGWRLIVVDDIGKEHHTSSRYSEGLLDQLFRNRYSEGAPSIVTTNFSIEKVLEIYGPSMHSYIHEAFWLVGVQPMDNRKKNVVSVSDPEPGHVVSPKRARR